MPMIRVREKHQITLPKEVVSSLQVGPDSYIEYFITNNGVFMRPAPIKKARKSIFDYAGTGGKQAYSSAQEADTFISSLRDEWNS